MPTANDSSGGVLRNAWRDWLKTPPRAHDEVEQHRTVTTLELFYDLVFVVLISQIAHSLGADVSWAGFLDYVVMFVLIWISWLNGSMYHEVHGRNDGRSRGYIFQQMIVLSALAVYAGHAIDDPALARAFGALFALLQVMIARQWWRVRPRESSQSSRRTLAVWVAWTGAVGLLTLVGGFLGEEPRLWFWFAAGLIFPLTMITALTGPQGAVTTITDSATERFGLLTIIVLGEVVVGVVNGMIEGGRTPIVMATGLISLAVGFGLWWNYFDSAGGVLPVARPRPMMLWTLAHLPLTAAIAAAGAGMVSLVAHADSLHTPTATAWLLAGATASTLCWQTMIVATVAYEPLRQQVRRPFIITKLIGAALCLLVAVWAPTPWLFSLSLTAILSLIWIRGFVLMAHANARMGLTHPLRADRESATD